MKIIFRPADSEDVPLILSLIRELAEYEKLAHEVTATEESLRESMFGQNYKNGWATAEVILAEIEGQAAGFCLFFPNYSTFLGKAGIYIEDLYVREKFRGQGIGKAFFKELARIAKERDYGRINWWVLDWNAPAIEFYKRLGAEAMDEWTVYRLSRGAIEGL